MSDLSTTEALQALIDRFLAGDATAKRDLVSRSYDRLTVVARRILRSFGSAEEETVAVLHESYAKLESALDAVRPATVRAYFGLAALQIRRVLLDAARKLRPARADVPLGGRGDDGTDHGGNDPSDSGAGREGVELDIVAAIDRLPEAEREVVDMLFWMGLTQAEAAGVIGVHEDTVKRRWASARIKLHGLLQAYDPGA